MPDLDFTALNRIAQQGFKTEQDKDRLIDAGFTILQGEKTPFDAPEPPATPRQPTTAPEALTGAYKAAFRLAYDFLNQHSPAQHSADYWVQTTRDAARITAQHPGNRLLMALMLAVVAELEGQYKEAIAVEPVQGGLLAEKHINDKGV